MKKINFAIVGATGLVGREMLKILSEYDFNIGKIALFATEKSEGEILYYKDNPIKVQKVQRGCFNDIDIALFSAGSSASKKIAPQTVKEGAIVIDNSNAFRMEKDVPLVVPEINFKDIPQDYKGIIANPNCSTIQMVLALYPIYKNFGLKRIIVSTYQAVSGTGKKAIEELKNQTFQVLNNKKIEKNVYPYQIAFNALPHIDIFYDNGFTREEMKMVRETKKILNDESIKINVTAVRIPVFYGHSESISFETEKNADVNTIKEALAKYKPVKLYDTPKENLYPMPIDAEKTDKILVGRLRADLDYKNTFNMWVVGNNIRKGAALNAVQIADYLIKNKII